MVPTRKNKSESDNAENFSIRKKLQINIRGDGVLNQSSEKNDI
jgi:hypothetical protein